MFPDIETHILHLLNIGDKNTQSKDINECRKMVAEIRRE